MTGNGRQALMQEPNSIRNPACGDRRDHGYADAGSFRDAEPEEKNYLRDNFGANRYRQGDLTSREWLPPLAITLDGPTGRWSMALGRTKWAVAGGNKTLSHGGLILLDTFVPFLTLSKI